MGKRDKGGPGAPSFTTKMIAVAILLALLWAGVHFGVLDRLAEWMVFPLQPSGR